VLNNKIVRIYRRSDGRAGTKLSQHNHCIRLATNMDNI